MGEEATVISDQTKDLQDKNNRLQQGIALAKNQIQEQVETIKKQDKVIVSHWNTIKKLKQDLEREEGCYKVIYDDFRAEIKQSEEKDDKITELERDNWELLNKLNKASQTAKDLADWKDYKKDLLNTLNYTPTETDNSSDETTDNKFFTDLKNSLPTYSDGNKVDLQNLIHWFKQMEVVHDQLDLFTEQYADINKIRGYQERKENADRIEAENIPGLFNIDRTINETVLGNIKTALTDNPTLTNGLLNVRNILDRIKTDLGTTDLSTANLNSLRDAGINLLTVQGQLTTSNNTIQQAEDNLGLGRGNIDNINNIRNGKTLQELVSDSNWKETHNCVNCRVSKHANYDDIEQALADERAKLAKQKECCSREKKEVEEKIIDKIITDLKLSVDKKQKNVLQAVIMEIKGKMNPPNDTGNKDKQAPENNSQKPSQESIDKVIEFSKKLSISDVKYLERIKNSLDHQELINVYGSAVQERLETVNKEKNKEIQSATILNYGLGFLCIGSLIILAYCIWKLTAKDFKKMESKK